MKDFNEMNGNNNGDSGNGEEKNKKSRSLMKAVFLRIGVAIVAVFAFLIFVGLYYDDFVNYLRIQRAEQFIEKMENEGLTEIQAMKEDTYGGATPEETLSLLITALEAGDVELASRYYLPWDQNKKKESYEKRLIEGELELLTQYFKGIRTDGDKNCGKSYNDKEWCVFEYEYITTEDVTYVVKGRDEKILVPKGSKDKDSLSFSLNHYTNVWKISR